ncbi:MAG: D-2-hydroxyacid dehydrogenase [Thermodesulfobacteriota bacterium]
MGKGTSRKASKKLNVLVTTPIGDKALSRIAALGSKINLRDVSDLVMADESGDMNATRRLDDYLAEADVIYGAAPPRRIVERAPKLRWIHSKLAGVEVFMDEAIVNSKVIVSNSRGIPATQVSEMVFEIMLMFVKHAPLYFRFKQERRWERIPPELLKGKTLGLVGFGSIGRAVARLAKAFGMRVIAEDISRSVRSRYVDLFLHPEELTQLFSKSDFVVVAVPLTPQTRKMVAKAELQSMKPTAYLINVSRGPVVDEEALVQALTEKRIAGAGLDVFTVEPLPADSRLWDLPNVIYSPHVAGTLATYNELTADFFCDNLKRYMKGQRLRNRVNKQRGY